MKEDIHEKKIERASCANSRRRPLKLPKFTIGDLVQKPPGPVKRIIGKSGPYTYVLENGFKVNSRFLKLISRTKDNDCEYVEIPQNRYPTRQRRPPDRLTYEAEKM